MNSKAISAGAFAIGVVLLPACTVIDQMRSPALERDAVWVVLPFVNHTETPQAGRRAEAVTEALLRSRGLRLTRYPATVSPDALFEPSDRKVVDEVLAWARGQGARYGITGSVEEWRYKVGIDGEPAVGITLQVVDVRTNDVLWTGTGGKTGWSREAVSSVAQKLIKEMVAGIRLH